ncbi:helix-turn-helix transcriptional regulator [bacterium]|nr:helix-turn-helix transcriptional regulator [bacterium]
MVDERKEYFSIGVVAQMLDVHPQTLRHYERKGLIQPSRTDGNTRLYSRSNVSKIEMILRLTTDLGVNLAGIEVILNMRDKIEHLEAERNDLIRAVFEALSAEFEAGPKEAQRALVKVQSGFLSES